MKHIPTLDYVTKRAGMGLGIYVKDLEIGCIVSIKTKSNHFYTMKILNPAESLAEITADGDWFNIPIEAHIAGSIIAPGSSCLVMRWIALDWCLEICPIDEPSRIITSRIKEIYIDDVKVLPIEGKYKH